MSTPPDMIRPEVDRGLRIRLTGPVTVDGLSTEASIERRGNRKRAETGGTVTTIGRCSNLVERRRGEVGEHPSIWRPGGTWDGEGGASGRDGADGRGHGGEAVGGSAGKR
jgi:hypothetical protein